MRPLTARQTEVLELIKTTMQETGMPPTRAEIARQLGFRSANAAEEHLKALARKGVIEILPGTSRGIKLNIPLDNEAEEEEGLPLIGRVAAGEPIPRDSAALEILWNFAVAQNTLHSDSSGITSPLVTLFHFGKDMFTIYALTIVSPKRIFALWKIAGQCETGYLVIAEKTLRENHEGEGTC